MGLSRNGGPPQDGWVGFLLVSLYNPKQGGDPLMEMCLFRRLNVKTACPRADIFDTGLGLRCPAVRWAKPPPVDHQTAPKGRRSPGALDLARNWSLGVLFLFFCYERFRGEKVLIKNNRKNTILKLGLAMCHSFEYGPFRGNWLTRFLCPFNRKQKGLPSKKNKPHP